MDKYLGCLFSFSCPHISWPSCWKESGQDKGVVPWVSVPLMPTWDQCVQKCFCGWFPAQCYGTWLWQSILTMVICLLLSAASPSSSSPTALPPHFSFCSFSLCPGAEQGGSCPALSSMPPAKRQPVQLPAAPTVTSGWLVLPQRACSDLCWWFIGFGGPYKWTEAITVASWKSPQITSPCLHFYVSFRSSLWISVCSWGQCFNSRGCCAQLYLAVLSGSLYLPGTHRLGRVA